MGRRSGPSLHPLPPLVLCHPGMAHSIWTLLMNREAGLLPLVYNGLISRLSWSSMFFVYVCTCLCNVCFQLLHTYCSCLYLSGCCSTCLYTTEEDHWIVSRNVWWEFIKTWLGFASRSRIMLTHNHTGLYKNVAFGSQTSGKSLHSCTAHGVDCGGLPTWYHNCKWVHSLLMCRSG